MRQEREYPNTSLARRRQIAAKLPAVEAVVLVRGWAWAEQSRDRVRQVIEDIQRELGPFEGMEDLDWDRARQYWFGGPESDYGSDETIRSNGYEDAPRAR